MRLLLDTYVLLWWLQGASLSDDAADKIADPSNDVIVSAATMWELTIKRQLGKVDMPTAIALAHCPCTTRIPSIACSSRRRR